MRIIKVIAEENFLLRILADNGQTGIFDVKPYLNSEAFFPLKERDEFQRIYNGQYYIEWDCGADLSADTIEAHWKLLPSELPNRTTRTSENSAVA